MEFLTRKIGAFVKKSLTYDVAQFVYYLENLVNHDSI
jgi:hypothetical protein